MKTGSRREDHVELPGFDRPVFIIAAPRSGSTLLFDSLRRVPGLWSIGGESHRIFDGVLQHYPDNRRFDSIRATAADATPARTAALVRLFTQRLVDGATGSRYLDIPLDLRPKSIRLLDKLPKNSFRVAFLAASFPDARFIFLWREPRGNISSLIDAWREGQRTGRFVTYPKLVAPDFENWCFVLPPGWRQVVGTSVEEIAAFQWMTANETALDDLQSLPRERWCTVQYDALIADPTAELGRLSAFIGLGFEHGPAAAETDALPLSRSALTPPNADKWRRNAAELGRVLPGVQATAMRLTAASS